jgi:UDP-glucose 4-epimerase
MPDYQNKVILITGGTGSFGETALRHFLASNAGEVRVFSRDEKKQDDMRHALQAADTDVYKRTRFFIGDVRDKRSISDAMQGVDYVFHAAALKQVPTCEFFPMEAVKTNVIGTDNVLRAGIDAGVQSIVCLSTDKAAHPINAMGISKALMEKVIAASARNDADRTLISCTRYGNVMCSRGSVIPLFVEQALADKPLTITDPRMTRFLMDLNEAFTLVEFAFEHAEPGDLFVQKAPAATVGDLAAGVQQLFGDTGIKVIGTRHGEKLYETLLTREEYHRAEDMGRYYRVRADTRDLNYDNFLTEGDAQAVADESYTSDNTEHLSVDDLVEKLLATDYIKEVLGTQRKTG